MKWKVLLKAVNYLVTTILFMTLLFTIYLVISSKTSGEDANLFDYQIKTVLSGSMEPDIQTGSIIFVKVGEDMTHLETNDVITFITEENFLITHRIIDIENGGEQFITKGDANDGADINPVLAENIVGKYTGVTVPYVGYMMSFATSNQGAALLLIVPGVLLIIRAFFTIWHVAQQVGRTKSEANANTK